MRINLIISCLLAFLFYSCNDKVKEEGDFHADQNRTNPTGDNKETLYWCPMDTQFVQKGPGSCPICGMDLEPKPLEHKELKSSKEWVYTPVNVAVLSTVSSIKPEMKTISSKLKVNGYVTYDQRRIYSIATRVAGRIEKLHVKYKFQPIRKGQPVFEIYSHDLQTAQEEYLFVKRNDPDNNSLINAAKRKLLLLGMTEHQINTISSADHLHATTTVYSPYSGFVIEKDDQPEAFLPAGSMSNNSSMGAALPMNEGSQEVSLREGAYVGKGESVFTVANIDMVWAVFEIYSKKLAQVKVNQTVHIISGNTGEMIMGKINFIEPAYKEGTGTTRLRVYLENKDHHLKIGTLLSGEIELGEKRGFYLPQSAVYDLGEDKIVFVNKGAAFETRKVTIGNTAGNQVEIIEGIEDGEEVAENAHFMVDSESFIRVNK